MVTVRSSVNLPWNNARIWKLKNQNLKNNIGWLFEISNGIIIGMPNQRFIRMINVFKKILTAATK